MGIATLLVLGAVVLLVVIVVGWRTILLHQARLL